MADCIFCKIAAGEIPADVIYQTDNFMAFMDVHPSVKGHVLVMPKQHWPNLHETPLAVVGELFKLAAKLAPLVRDGAGAEGYNIGMNNGPAAGQMVLHTHVHILPRRADDGRELWTSGEYASGEAEDYFRRIKSAVEKTAS